MSKKVLATTFRATEDDLRDMDDDAKSFAMNRNDFLIHLWKSWRNFKPLEPVERTFLMYLALWGVQIFRDDRPTLKVFAERTNFTQDGVRNLVDRFVAKGWMEERKAAVGKQFYHDLTIDGKVFGLTDAGLRIAGFAH